MSEGRLIARRHESVPLSETTDEEIASAINRVVFHQEAPVLTMIMNAKRQAQGVITAINHMNATAKIAVQYRDIVITAARTVRKCVMDVAVNVSCVGTDLSAVITWVGLGLCAAEPHALLFLCTCQLDLARVSEFRSIERFRTPYNRL
jgi:hypothetical protein